MALSIRQQGQFLQADFFENLSGLNNTDSPFRVLSSQAVSGYNYDYQATGGLSKRAGHTLLNATPASTLRSVNFSLFNTSVGVKTLIRVGDTSLQTVNTTTGAVTNTTDDTASANTVIYTDSLVPVVSSVFNTTSINTIWFAGGQYFASGLSGFTGSHTTTNGSDASTVAGTFGVSASGAGGTIPTGTYLYGLALVKLSTGAISNVVLDKSVGVTLGQNVVIDLSGLTSYDTTKYSTVRIYRSAIAGVVGFTTGDLVTTIAAGGTYTDAGAVQGTAAAVPRASNTLLDNSILPTVAPGSVGNYNTITTWKRRLVTAAGSTVYMSDLNKPESWPTQNFITIPSGGKITGLAIIAYTTDTTTSTDEFLVIFKERELWVVSGTSASDWSLKFVDYVGCVSQPMIVLANGFLFFIDYRGVYLWDGSGKPIYISRPIEYDFSPSGDIDKSLLTHGVGSFFRKQNEILWILPSISLGDQCLGLKLDLRLTLPNVATALAGRILEGVFIKDSLVFSGGMTACLAALPNYDETFYAGDSNGNIYKLFDNFNSDNGTAIPFRYRTKTEDFGLIGTCKRYHKVVIWALASTVNNLTLKYWVDYRTDVTHQGAAQQQPVSTGVTSGIWDQGTWDGAYWDSNVITYVPIVFNLQDPTIGTEGDALTLEFNQADASSPLVIAGYSIIFTSMGLRK